MWQSILKAWGYKRVDPGGGYPEKEGGIEREYTVCYSQIFITSLPFNRIIQKFAGIFNTQIQLHSHSNFYNHK